MTQPRLIGDKTNSITTGAIGPTRERLRRLDSDPDLRRRIIPYCRLQEGEIWEDHEKGHRVGVLDATQMDDLRQLARDDTAQLVIADPPYNVSVGNARTLRLFKVPIEEYLAFSSQWISNAIATMACDSYLYIWTGADYRDDFQPLPDLIGLLRKFDSLTPRNLITVRNQRGYGTSKNWMWVRQELLCYAKGHPEFNVDAEYTDIPKTLKGYYKDVKGKQTENIERGKSPFIRAGNVWIDVQQVFYRLEENVPGCYAQKPLKAIERIIRASSSEDDLVIDLFCHSGTGLIAGERLNRRVFCFDIDPVFAELTIRRLELYRSSGRTGWQWRNPFPELD